MPAPTPAATGLRISRRFTTLGNSPYGQFAYARRSSVIRNPTGEAVFEMHDVEVPEGWSQVATDILAQKYFRKAGVPQPDGTTGPETSARQTVHRMAETWRHWGAQHGYFATEADSQAFYDELVYMLLAQMAAPNSPQWFNTGLHQVYGIEGPAQGHYYVDPANGELRESTSAYERPQPHACFILSVDDDLVNPGGIMDLWVREARIFKYGSGTGTNFSNLRGEGERLSGGGTSSGVMSWLRIGDRAAGAIKSGGTTRRAAKMVVLDIDHPEIEKFIQWKVEEERKVAALVAAGYPSDYEGEAYRTVSGQNSNNSVRVTDEFLAAVIGDGAWNTVERTDGKIHKTLKARKLWDDIARAAWQCADPGLQYHTTINDWHTCPADGPIRASNPCSEYMFLDNTACNLASLNLRKFYNPETRRFDTEAYLHAVRLWTIVLEISVLMAQYPSPEIARLSYKFRTLGLGYANLGSLLMVSGIAYDSPKARAIAGALTAMMTAQAYETSAELAENLGTFEGFAPNREAMLRVIRNHRYAAYNAQDAYENLHTPPMGIDPAVCPGDLLEAACNAWDRALRRGETHGFRNAQVTVLAPTGTIGLLMDCDTTGVEPDFALVKFKKLSGGGYFKIVNQSVPLALQALGYNAEDAETIVRHAIGHGKLEGAPFINPESLKAKGLTDADIAKVNYLLPSAFDIAFAFAPYVLGESAMRRLGFTPEQYEQPSFHLLKALGFTHQQILEANDYICGTQTVEGAPGLRDEHLPVFDCANRCGRTGTRFIHAHGHLRMMAAAQSFISGAISKTINLPNEATWEEIRDCYHLGHKWGLKAISIYRDGSKLSQPLSSKTDGDEGEVLEAETAARTVPEPLGQDQLLAVVRRALAEPNASPLAQSLQQLVNRRPLPNRRQGFTQKAKIDGQTVFVRTGEYEDGRLGEIFIDMAKEGATLRSLMNCFAISVSIGLQYGVPLEEFVDKFAFTRFDPAGQVQGHPNIKNATSIVDFIFRLLAFEYLGREDLVHVLPAMLDDTKATRQAEREALEANPPATQEIPQPQPESISVHPTNATQSVGAEQQLLSNLMGDAPACNVCGHITIRNGTCYKCLNCGNSLGCS